MRNALKVPAGTVMFSRAAMWNSRQFGISPALAKPGDKIAGQYICVFKSGAVTPGNARSEAARSAGGGLNHVYSNSIRGFSASAGSAAALQAHNPKIAYCEQDQEVDMIQSDPLAFRVLGKPAPTPPAQSVPWGVTRVGGGSGSSTHTA